MKKPSIRKINSEVMYLASDVVTLSRREIALLKKALKKNSSKKCRFCAHKNDFDPVHEMFIAHTPQTYVRPHKHLGKPEAFYVIEGEADVVIFDETGNVNDIIPVGEYGSGRYFYYRLQKPLFHTIIIKSDPFIFHEITKGPFKKSDTIFAKWSPDAGDKAGVRKFIKNLSCRKK